MITIDDPIGLLRFGFSKEIFEDRYLNRMKKFQKKLVFFAMAVFLTYPIFLL
jgi:hypothetical protein